MVYIVMQSQNYLNQRPYTLHNVSLKKWEQSANTSNHHPPIEKYILMWNIDVLCSIPSLCFYCIW